MTSRPSGSSVTNYEYSERIRRNRALASGAAEEKRALENETGQASRNNLGSRPVLESAAAVVVVDRTVPQIGRPKEMLRLLMKIDFTAHLQMLPHSSVRE